MTTPYVGTELELFSHARNWKRYLATLLLPWFGSHVLEVGAGLGSNIPTLFIDPVKQWTALEPDADLAHQIRGASRVLTGTLKTLDPFEYFDTILYLDVVEHIEDDAAELTRAIRHITPGGHLIVLVPAHSFLFSPFDQAIGHFRRYNRNSLRQIGPANARLEQMLMLDSMGLFASLANRIVLRAKTPTARQIQVWDRTMVPVSRIIDRITGYHVGKSVLGIWSVL